MGRMLKIAEVTKMIGMSRDFIYDRLATGTFPPGAKFGRSRRWDEDEVQAWIQGRWRKRVGRKEVVNP